MNNNIKSLTGGMMVIVVPGRKVSWTSSSEITQQESHQLIKLSTDVIRNWACTPLKDEMVHDKFVPKHTLRQRLQYWLNEHFLHIVGAHSLDYKRCSWTFNHDKN